MMMNKIQLKKKFKKLMPFLLMMFFLSNACEMSYQLDIPELLQNKQFTTSFEKCLIESEAPLCAGGREVIGEIIFKIGTDNISIESDEKVQDNALFGSFFTSLSNINEVLNNKEELKLMGDIQQVILKEYRIKTDTYSIADTYIYSLELEISFVLDLLKYKEIIIISFEKSLNTNGIDGVSLTMGLKNEVKELPSAMLFFVLPEKKEIQNIKEIKGYGFYNVKIDAI